MKIRSKREFRKFGKGNSFYSITFQIIFQKLTISIISKTWDFEYSIDEMKKWVLWWSYRWFNENEDESYNLKIENIEWDKVFIDYIQKEDFTNNNQKKIQEIQKKFDEIQTLYNSIWNDLQEKISKIHWESCPLPYCIRWWNQAIDEYIQENY